jgi:hypothetical protein
VQSKLVVTVLRPKPHRIEFDLDDAGWDQACRFLDQRHVHWRWSEAHRLGVCECDLPREIREFTFCLIKGEPATVAEAICMAKAFTDAEAAATAGGQREFDRRIGNADVRRLDAANSNLAPGGAWDRNNR